MDNINNDILLNIVAQLGAITTSTPYLMDLRRINST